jgi:pyridoxine kinase
VIDAAGTVLVPAAAFCRVTDMNLLSIQSHVAYGHVGNSAAVFPLQRIGVEVWPIHTVQFSNSTRYNDWTGQVFDAAMIRDVMSGIEKRGILGECDGVLSGYVGSAEIGAAVLDAVKTVKAANPAARYCCDPVIGDIGRDVFVQPGVAEFFRDHAVAAADILTPNQFELDHLTGRESRTLAQAFAAIDALHDLGPSAIMVTSYFGDDTPPECIDLLASDPNGRVRVRTPKLPIEVNGAGDAIAALFLAHYLRSGTVGEALARSASALFGVLSKTLEAGSQEILFVAAQDELVKPTQMFEAETLGG